MPRQQFFPLSKQPSDPSKKVGPAEGTLDRAGALEKGQERIVRKTPFSLVHFRPFAFT